MGKNLLVWLVIAVVLLTVFQNFSVKKEPQRLNYSEFLGEVRSERIATVEIDDNIIYGERKSGDAFQVVRPPLLPDNKLIDDLYNANVVCKASCRKNKVFGRSC